MDDVQLGTAPLSVVITILISLGTGVGLPAKLRPIVAILASILLVEVQLVLTGPAEPLMYFNQAITGLVVAASASGLYSWVKTAVK